MSEQVTVRLLNGSFDLVFPTLVDDGICWPFLLLTNMVTSIFACCLLIISSSHHLLLPSWAFITAIDSLFNQGGAALFRPPSSCLPLATSSLFFFFLQISVLASLSVFPSPSVPVYLNLLIPSIMAMCITAPFLFPQIAVARYFPNRQNCGFISFSSTHSVITLIVGFILPLCTMYYISTRSYFTLQDGSITRNEKSIVIIISICSVLLIPHIIQINITHFSIKLFKSNLQIETNNGNIYEALFIWFKYSFNVVTPIAMLCASRNVTKEWKHLFYNLYTHNSLSKYLKKKKMSRLLSAQSLTPVLFLTKRGLILNMNKINNYIDIPYNLENLKVDSSISADFSISSNEKSNNTKKKIVRFAHSIKDISIKDSEWDYNSD